MPSDWLDPPHAKGFTLVEVLVVIAILGILAGVLLPAIQATRESARRTECNNQLRQLGLASTTHATQQTSYPAGVEQWFFAGSVTYRGIPLFARLLPYLEEQAALNNWDYTDPIHNSDQGKGSNTALVIPQFICPSDDIPQNPITVSGKTWVYALGSYGGNGGTRTYPPRLASTNGMFHTTGEASEPKPNQKSVSPRDVVDGLSRTLLIGERTRTDPGYASFNDQGWGDPLAQWGWWGASTSRKMIGHVTMSSIAPINYQLPFSYDGRAHQSPPATDQIAFESYVELRVSAYGSQHPKGANFCFADGSVHFLMDDIELSLLAALSTRDGSEITIMD